MTHPHSTIPPSPPPEDSTPRRRRPRSLPKSLLGPTVPKQAGGRQGRSKRSPSASQARGPKRRPRDIRDLRKAEEGAVVRPPVPEREPRHPNADQSGYDAIAEVL